MGTAGRGSGPSGGGAHLAFRRIMHRGQLLCVRARYAGSDFGSSEAYIAETYGKTPSFLSVLQLHEFPETNAWRDEVYVRQPRLVAGSSQLFDLRDAWRTEVTAPFDNVHINVTQDTLDALADEAEVSRIELRAAPFENRIDDTLRNLSMALLPALRRPSEMAGLFADHILWAAAAHLADTYGGMKSVGRRMTGGLAPWQERRVRDLMLTHLDQDLEMATLASACGLSPGHFAKAFKRTTGLPPHRWLLRQRVSRVCEMLLQTDRPLGVIAVACGFADQSHMTRVFSRAGRHHPGCLAAHPAFLSIARPAERGRNGRHDFLPPRQNLDGHFSIWSVVTGILRTSTGATIMRAIALQRFSVFATAACFVFVMAIVAGLL